MFKLFIFTGFKSIMKTGENKTFLVKSRVPAFILSFWKSFVWGITIILLSLLSGNKIEKISLINFQHSDKVIHFFMYFVFSYFLYEGFRHQYNEIIKIKNQIMIVLLISVIFGVVMEILQLTIATNRSAEILDFVSNLAGSVLAIVLFNKIQEVIQRLKVLVIKK